MNEIKLFTKVDKNVKEIEFWWSYCSDAFSESENIIAKLGNLFLSILIGGGKDTDAIQMTGGGYIKEYKNKYRTAINPRTEQNKISLNK